MRVFVSAAEISSDIHAEKILRALIAQLPGVPLEICGIGGPALRSVPGFRCLQDAESMRTMGFVEVLGKIPSLLSIQSKIITCLDEYPPDLILTFDYPDFHFSLLQKLSKKSWFGNSLRICGIPPKVWVWRKHRVEKIRRLYDGVWVIFPFERDFYENLGIPVIYEGNPLISDLVLKSAGAGDPEAAQDMKERILRLAALPGSREAEIRGHLPILSRTLEQLSVLTGRPVVAEIPVPKGLDPARIESQLPSTERVRYRFSAGDSGAVLARNPIGLIKSGTSTLEAAVLGCVPVIFYRMSPVSEWIFRTLVRYRGPVGLPNILLGIRDRSQAVFPEFLGGEANPDSLAREIELLLANPEILENRKRAGASLRDQLVSKGDVASRVAQEILKWRESVASAGILRRRATWISLVSALWSVLNSVRRWLHSAFGIVSRKIGVRSVLVGNLQAGGAGKTPLVIALVQEAQRRGFKVGVVSRGYGVKKDAPLVLAQVGDGADQIGDEPAEILAAVPGVRVALSSDRIRASDALIREGVDFIVADDGFQNLHFTAGVTVLAVTDAARNEVVYRDFDRAASHADFVIQTKGKRTARFGKASLIEWDALPAPSEPLWLWCGLGDPDEVVHFYRARGYRIERVVRAPDHAVPEQAFIERLLEEARVSGAVVAMTPKDRVKIPAVLEGRIRILSRQIRDQAWMEAVFQRLQ